MANSIKDLEKGGHWIDESDVKVFGLELTENTYYCRNDGSCDGHSEYVHPESEARFHCIEDCKVQNND